MRWAIARGGGGDTAPAVGWLDIDGPMTVAAALRAAGQWSLDSPRRDFDDEEWWFGARFDSQPGDAILGFDGIATCSQVFLNGEPIGRGNSMFVAHRFDVETLLRASGNELLVHCLPLNEQLKARRPRPRWRTPMLTQQQLRWWRTTLLGRTPGWSPPAAPVGLWRDVWLAPRDAIAARDVRVHTRVEGSDGIVHLAIDSRPPAGMQLRLSRGGREWRLPVRGDATLRMEGVELWWPHTHGEPALYDAALAIEGTDEIRLAPVGFRTVEADTSGGGFRIRVNGEPVFCRGAVWMPLDPVSLRAPQDQYADAVAQAASAGMNMLRVAGIAAYEEDAFYEACDRAGVLVWQDFMFANMDYPVEEAFTNAVETEARQQLARFAAHPCIAVLCGNSEAEQQAAMWGAPRDAWEQPLFHATLPRLCSELAPDVPYWPSSAHGGALPQQADQGTTSYYGVGAYLRPLEDARRSHLRFATECLAFSNVPSTRALARMPGGESLRPHHPAWKERVPRDLGAGWDFEDVRDHYFERLFGGSAREARSTDAARYLELSRMASAQVMSAAFSEWRRPDSGCGGALVLMLRDLWPGPGWGLVDDQGVPKACFHALKRVLQPVGLLITDEGLNGLDVHVVNDRPRPAQLILQLKAWHAGDAVVAEGERPVDVPARGGITVAAASLLDHFIDLNWSHRFGPPPCDVVACILRDDTGRIVARAHHFPHGRALSVERDIGLHARIVAHDNVGCAVAVTTRQFAYGVHFDFPGMTAQDDYFHLSPGDEAVVELRGTLAPHGSGWVHAINSARGARIGEHSA